MKYTQPRFSVTSDWHRESKRVCEAVGHMAPDVRGKCLRCATKVTDYPPIATPCS